MTDELTRRPARLDACAVSDTMDVLGLGGVVAGLPAVSTATRIAGRAIAVKLGPADGRPADGHFATAALDGGAACEEQLMAEQVLAGETPAAAMGRDCEEMLNDGAAT